MALESYCAACTYLSENADSYGKYWCSRKGEDHYACDPKCYNWLEAYSRSTSARENMYNNSLSHSSGGCYLTTAMCNILGYNDDNYYLQTLRTFRDTKLKQDIKYLPILISYDTIGPQIADKLLEDKNKQEISQMLFTRFITQAVTAIEHNKINEAVFTYVAMTQSLAERYNINTNIAIPDPNEIDFTLLGHGRTRKRVQTEQTV